AHGLRPLSTPGLQLRSPPRGWRRSCGRIQTSGSEAEQCRFLGDTDREATRTVAERLGSRYWVERLIFEQTVHLLDLEPGPQARPLGDSCHDTGRDHRHIQKDWPR